MEIDIQAETKKMRSEMRKVGDMSGIGFDQPVLKYFDRNTKPSVTGQHNQESLLDQRVMKEAELLLQGKDESTISKMKA